MALSKEGEGGRAVKALKLALASAFLCASLAIAIPVFIARASAGAACRALEGALPLLPVKLDGIRFTKHPTSERCDVSAVVLDPKDEPVLREFLSSRLTEAQRQRTRIVIELADKAPNGKGR